MVPNVYQEGQELTKYQNREGTNFQGSRIIPSWRIKIKGTACSPRQDYDEIRMSIFFGNRNRLPGKFVFFFPQTSFGIVGFHQTTRSCIMETWKKVLREKCPTIPCRTNVSASPVLEAWVLVACSFPGHRISCRKTINLSKPIRHASSSCESWPSRLITHKTLMDLWSGTEEGRG